MLQVRKGLQGLRAMGIQVQQALKVTREFRDLLGPMAILVNWSARTKWASRRYWCRGYWGYRASGSDWFAGGYGFYRARRADGTPRSNRVCWRYRHSRIDRPARRHGGWRYRRNGSAGTHRA